MRRRPPTSSRSTRASSRAWSPRATPRSRCACSPSGTCASTSRRDRREAAGGEPHMVQLIDRRASSRGRSAVNRERFLRRYKSHIQQAVRKMVDERRLADMEQGGEVRVPKKDISEPSFGYGAGGDREFVLPGNREYVAGDRIPRPDGAAGGGAGGAERRPSRRASAWRPRPGNRPTPPDSTPNSSGSSAAAARCHSSTSPTCATAIARGAPSPSRGP